MLSRHEDEVVVIQAGDQIVTVTLVDIRGDKCRLGFEADKGVVIDRKEVWDAKRSEQRLANEARDARYARVPGLAAHEGPVPESQQPAI